MNSLSTQAFSVVAMATLAVAVALTSSPLVAAISSVSVACALASVAFAAQSRHLRDKQHLVYRPVHVRSQSVQRRVRSDD